MRRDEPHLLDILIAVRGTSAFVGAIARNAFAETELHQHSVVRRSEIFGEAVTHIFTRTVAQTSPYYAQTAAALLRQFGCDAELTAPAS